jgi:hypothetical protein
MPHDRGGDEILQRNAASVRRLAQPARKATAEGISTLTAISPAIESGGGGI